jgi:Protein of unknown function (DUF1638)
MPLGIICCKVLEREVRAVARNLPVAFHLEVMEWGLHVRPALLLEALCERVRALQERVDAIVLGYGRCQTLDNLPEGFKVPIFYPEGEDCIGVLLGGDRYREELQREAHTWFLTPGWTALGMEFIFHELQLHRMAEKGFDPLHVARRMLKDYRRALFIEMDNEDTGSLLERAQKIADDFHMMLESTRGSLTALERAVSEALRHCAP